MKRTYMQEHTNTRNIRASVQSELRNKRRQELLNRMRNTSIATQSTLPDYHNIKAGILSADLPTVHESAVKFRQFLSRSNAPPIQEVLETNLVPKFVELISQNNILYLQEVNVNLVQNTRMEAAWILTNIAAGDTLQTNTIIEYGGIPLLFKMLNESNQLADQAIWCLGNIAGDSELFRDNILNFPDSLVTITNLYEREDINISKNITWLLSNLARGRHPPIQGFHADFLGKVFIQLIKMQQDQEMFKDALWGVSYVLESSPGVIKEVDLHLLMKKLEEFTNIDMERLLNLQNCIPPLIRCIGNASLDATHGSFLYSKNIILLLIEVFKLELQPKIQREIIWVIGNLALSFDILQAHDLLFLCLEHEEKAIKKEAMFALIRVNGNITFYRKLLVYIIKMYNLTEDLNAEIVASIRRYCERGPEFVEATRESDLVELGIYS